MIESIDYSSTTMKIAGGYQYNNAYGSFTFKEVEIQKIGYTPNTDNWNRMGPSTQEEQVAHMKPRYTGACLEYEPRTRNIWKDISGRADDVIGKFMDGTISEDELASQFQVLAHEVFEETAKVGYPIPMIAPCMEQACTEAMYDEFRLKILNIAVHRNNEQGKQYITGKMEPQRTWKYYNSDYYYKSEEAITSITKGMDEFVQDRGWNYTIPDYKGKNLNMLYNFNSAFSNNFCQELQYILDPDVAPPRGFEWFYQTGGKYSSYGKIEGHTSVNSDGSIITKKYIQREKFDPEDFYTANTWAAYIDQSGKRHVISKDIIFKDDKSDLKNVGSLLKFFLGEESDLANQFLGNLQLYPRAYFTRIAEETKLNYVV